MSRNIAVEPGTVSPPDILAGRSLVLVGLMGAGKTSIGRRLASRLGLPFKDADAEIEEAAGCTVPEIFSRFGEQAFRDGERRVIRRLLSGPPLVLAFGGGAFLDPETRALTRRNAISVWLRAPLPVLVRRVAGRDHRPLLAGGDHAAILERLLIQRSPLYAEADLIVDCTDETPEITTSRVVQAMTDWNPPQRLDVTLPSASYQVIIGERLLERAGALLASVLPQKRAVIITDESVAPSISPPCTTAWPRPASPPPPSSSPPARPRNPSSPGKTWSAQLLDQRVERRTAIIALGGGVIGDLAGFAAASTLRGLPFIQIPTTLLAQVDSSVGGKTGVNTAHGKNLVGAFHQPRMVIADTATLATLPIRELRAGYAEIIKAGLIGDAAFFAWCEQHGPALLAGDRPTQAEAIHRACAFKAEIVGDDEREEKPSDGRALLNLGHTFAHALEAEYGYTGGLLHGEAVAVGLGLAFRLSARLGLCPDQDAQRVVAHVESAVCLRNFPPSTDVSVPQPWSVTCDATRKCVTAP